MPKIATDTIISLQFEMEPCDWHIHDASRFLKFLICFFWWVEGEMYANDGWQGDGHVVSEEKIFVNWKWSTKWR